jgi:exodeoxyribonuclease VII large subunit
MTPHRLIELNQLIRNTLDANLAPSYWVVAEIAELRNNPKGHCYLELVEKENEEIVARMKANIWSYTYRGIASWFESITGSPLQSGMKVLCQAKVQFHELYGISLSITDIDPNYTLGERARKRQQTLEQLKADGIFEMNKELPLPILPQRLAIISSATAAGYGDFMNQLQGNRYQYQFECSLFPAIMQGDQAPGSITEAMHEVAENLDHFDLLLIVRGGGAQVDLDCFDDYNLASHVAQFPIPVITGIGHERDQSVVDLVAHTQMKTPTAVAEFLISGMRALEERIQGLAQALYQSTQTKISDAFYHLVQCAQQIKLYVKDHTHRQVNTLLKRESAVQGIIKQNLNTHSFKIKSLQSQLNSHWKEKARQEESMLQSLQRQLSLNDPETIMAKGYSISKINGQLLHKVKDIKAGMTLETWALNYSLKSEVTDLSPKKALKASKKTAI